MKNPKYLNAVKSFLARDTAVSTRNAARVTGASAEKPIFTSNR